MRACCAAFTPSASPVGHLNLRLYPLPLPLPLPLPFPKLATAACWCCLQLQQCFSFPRKIQVVKSDNSRRKAQSLWCASDSTFNTNYKKICGVENGNFVVVNFYRFVFIKGPRQVVDKHLTFLEDLNIQGRIYINEQGINAQFSGPSEDAFAYVDWVKEDERFSDILVQTSPAVNGHAFPKLKLRYKPSLVQLEGGISHLLLLDPSMRATGIAPSEWRKMLEAENKNDEESNSNPSTEYILLDMRNGYEWDVGHFQGAQRPNVDCFRSTSFGLSPTEGVASDQLSNVDKEKTAIMMYCTGGIRCDVYSTILRQQGFKNLYTLEGGISHYLKTEGPVKWIGNLFVFDSRLSLAPSAYNPETMIEDSAAQQAFENDKFARCYICGSHVSEFRHRNCANLDCNLLFLCCANCVMDLKGCCCYDCTTAPRLRPVLPGFQRYTKWHIYRDRSTSSSASASLMKNS